MTVLPVVLTATFMQLLDVTIAQVAIPSIRAGLHAGSGTLQLVLAGYTLAYACLLITAARLGDRFGYRRLFVLGLVVFTVASAACAAAPAASVLVAARVVQGAGSGLMAPQVFSIIQTALPASQRPRALSFLGATMGIASLSGPVLGALLLGLGGWRLLFLVNLPVSLLALAGAGRLPKTRSPSAPKVDAPGAALAMGGLGLLVFPLSVGRELHWPLWTFGCFAAAIVLLLLFARSQARGREPLLHPSVLRDRRPVRGGRDPRQPHRATDRPQVRIPAPDRRGRHARPGHGCLGLARHRTRRFPRNHLRRTNFRRRIFRRRDGLRGRRFPFHVGPLCPCLARRGTRSIGHESRVQGLRMTKRVAGRSRLRSPTGPSKSAAARRWWKRGTTAVLTAGALAGAISAVLALRPTPDPEDSADITAVRVIPQVTMSEYVQRLEASGQGHFGRAFAARQSTSEEPTGESTSPAQSSSSSPRSKSSRSSSAGPTSPETSTAPPTTSPAAKMKANGGFDVVPGTHPDEVLNYIAERDRLSARQFAEYQAILPAVINGASLDDKGQPVDPEVAAQHVLAVLDDARVAGDGTEPVGALVSVDVTLAGLRGKPVALRWSMWKSGGGGQLHGDWLNDNLAYRLEATTARDTTTVDLWVPMPRQEGPYLIRAQLATGSSPLAGKDSEPFS